jgi:putative FmdB family regulatory protein
LPIYEYRCEACQKVFEELVLGSAQAEAVCPSCGRGSAQRLMSATARSGTGEAASDGGRACGPVG